VSRRRIDPRLAAVRSRQRADEPLIRSVELAATPDPDVAAAHPWNLPVIDALERGLELHPKVTYLIGENGSGKSTLLEAIAVAAGLNPEGGSSNFAFATRDSHSSLWESIRLVRGSRQPRSDFFLRAESIFNAASYLDEDARSNGPGRSLLDSYGGRSLHEQSHGESFLAIMLNRFGADGFYVMDEPEAALSAQNCLTCLRRIHELVQEGCQFVIATHSPIILAYPDATIYECGAGGLAEIGYEQAAMVHLFSSFMADRERMLALLLAESAPS
jgi:predicted ATPase